MIDVIRVITAMAYGVISAAPKPCTARAVISTVMDSDKPQHSDARVNTPSPDRDNGGVQEGYATAITNALTAGHGWRSAGTNFP